MSVMEGGGAMTSTPKGLWRPYNHHEGHKWLGGDTTKCV
jgi:hypothetical protein